MFVDFFFKKLFFALIVKFPEQPRVERCSSPKNVTSHVSEPIGLFDPERHCTREFKHDVLLRNRHDILIPEPFMESKQVVTAAKRKFYRSLPYLSKWK